MIISGIYQIQSKIKIKRIYIGSAINIENRWWHHLSDLRLNKHHSIKLQRHFNKYGESDLQFSILLGCDKEDLIKIEQYFLDSFRPYFNNCLNANSRFGAKISDETSKKMSVASKGRHHDCGCAGWNKDMKLSENHKYKLSKAHEGKKHSEETKQKMKHSHKKKK